VFDDPNPAKTLPFEERYAVLIENQNSTFVISSFYLFYSIPPTFFDIRSALCFFIYKFLFFLIYEVHCVSNLVHGWRAINGDSYKPA